jgi:hypothetical protein
MGVRSDKLRGLGLLALVVVSVFAGTAGTVGSATAANDGSTPTRTPTPDEPMPLKASFDPGVAAQNTTTLELGRSKGNGNLTVTADGLDAETILTVFDEESDAFINGNGEVEFQVLEEAPSIGADFSGIQAGNYEFAFEVEGTGEAATATVRVISPDKTSPDSSTDASPAFVGGKVKVTRGGVAKIPIRTKASTRMRVHIASDSGGYKGSFIIRSGREDDLTRLKLNTFTLGRHGNQYEAGISGTAVSAASTVSSDDKVLSGRLNQSTPLLDSVDPGTYTLRVTVNGKQTDKSSLKIKPLSNTRVWTRAAPKKEFDEYYTVSDVRSAVADEGDRESIALGDVLVMGIQKSGLSGVLATGDDPLQQLLAHNGSAFSLTIKQQDPKTNQTAKILDLGETIRRDRLEIFRDEENAVVYLLGRTDELIFRDGPAGVKNTVAAGDQFEAELTLLRSGSLVESEQTSETTFETVERAADFRHDGNMVTVQSKFDQSINGSTTVAPGTKLEVRARNRETDQFLKRTTVEVSPEQTFESTFDFADVGRNTTFRLNVTGIPDADTVGIVGEPLRASVSFDKQRMQNDTISLSSVTLSHGGYFALRNDSTSGAVVGISQTLSPGRHSNVTVPISQQWNGSKTLVAVPYYNRTGVNRTSVQRSDVGYQRGGSIRSDAATITRPSANPDGNETQSTDGSATNGSGTPATADLQTPFDDADDPGPRVPDGESVPVTTAGDSAGPRLADLSVVAYGVVALGMLVVFVVARD